jgi:hypothetical protein
LHPSTKWKRTRPGAPGAADTALGGGGGGGGGGSGGGGSRAFAAAALAALDALARRGEVSDVLIIAALLHAPVAQHVAAQQAPT